MLDLKELRRRITGAANEQGVYGPTWINPREALALLDRLEAAEHKAARMEWLAPRFMAADFDFQESGISAAIFDWPDGAPISADIFSSIDAAMAATKGETDGNH